MNSSSSTLFSFFFAAGILGLANMAAGDARPVAAARALDAEVVMRTMETPVKPEVLAAFQEGHPAPYWLFGEDRQRAVRRNIIPAHWFEEDVGIPHSARSWNWFAGTARPGEFYVFQVCVVAGKTRVENLVPRLVIAGLPDAAVHAVSRPLTLGPGEVKPYWIGIEVPQDAKPGRYDGTARTPAATMQVELTVAGEPIADSGTGEAWRLARLKWLDSTVGESETVVTRPFTPIRVDEAARTLDILGRRITLGPNGIPSQYTSYFSGSNTKIVTAGIDAFAAPPCLDLPAATAVPRIGGRGE